jgi:hypothetical protein
MNSDDEYHSEDEGNEITNSVIEDSNKIEIILSKKRKLEIDLSALDVDISEYKKFEKIKEKIIHIFKKNENFLKSLVIWY